MKQKLREKRIVRYFDTAKLKHKIELVKNCDFDFILSSRFSQIIIWICRRQLAIVRIAHFALIGFVVYIVKFSVKSNVNKKHFNFFRILWILHSSVCFQHFSKVWTLKSVSNRLISQKSRLWRLLQQFTVFKRPVRSRQLACCCSEWSVSVQWRKTSLHHSQTRNFRENKNVKLWWFPSCRIHGMNGKKLFIFQGLSIERLRIDDLLRKRKLKVEKSVGGFI